VRPRDNVARKCLWNTASYSRSAGVHPVNDSDIVDHESTVRLENKRKENISGPEFKSKLHKFSTLFYRRHGCRKEPCRSSMPRRSDESHDCEVVIGDLSSLSCPIYH
jgi:hypothetical protein